MTVAQSCSGARVWPLHIPILTGRGSRPDFCGPTAMASVTGIPIVEVREAIYAERRDLGKLRINGHNMPIGGLGDEELIGAMDRLGWSLVEHRGDPTLDSHKQPKLTTLAEFCRERGAGGPFIVGAGLHWQAISAGEFCDTFTMVPISIELAMRPGKGRAGRWVKTWYRFLPIV